MAIAEAQPIQHVVADPERVSWLRITLVIVGITISIPAFIVGAQLSLELGLRAATIAMFAGGAILTAVGIATMLTGSSSGLASYALIREAFGPAGARVVNLVLIVTIVGWYAVTLEMFGTLLHAQLAESGMTLPLWLLLIVGSVLMIGTTLFGFQGVDRFSRMVVPLLIAVMLWGVWSVMRQATFADLWSRTPMAGGAIPSVGTGVSVVVGALMVGVAVAPDFGRFAANGRHALAASIASYGIGFPAVLLLAGLPALISGRLDFLANMNGIGRVPVLFVVIFAIWTTNVGNLYSAGLAIEQVSTVPGRTATLIAGGAGTMLALFGISDDLVPLIVALAVVIPPIAGIYVVSYWTQYFRLPVAAGYLAGANSVAFGAWGVAIAAGALAGRGTVALTGIVALDSLLTAMVAYLVLGAALYRFRTEMPAAAATKAGSIEK